MKILLFIPVLFMTLSQPFTLSLMLTLQTVITSMYLYSAMKIVWMALTLVLVIVGGLMISFVYVSSLMPAEPYSRTHVWMSPLVIMPFMFICVVSMFNLFNMEILEYSPMSLFNSNTYLGTILIVGVLIMTLLMVCVNTLQIKCPMRSYS